jgi:hypothetical protein
MFNPSLSLIPFFPFGLNHRFRILKKQLDILPKSSLIAFQGNHGIPTMINNFLTNCSLSPHGINRNDWSRKVQKIQKLWNGRDFIGLVINLRLSQDHSTGIRPSGDGGTRENLIVTIMGSPHGLPINRNTPFHITDKVLGKPIKTASKNIPIQSIDDSSNRFVGGNAFP